MMKPYIKNTKTTFVYKTVRGLLVVTARNIATNALPEAKAYEQNKMK